MIPGTISSIVALALELPSFALTAAPLVDDRIAAGFRRITDPSQPQAKRSAGRWALLAVGAVMLCGMSFVAIGRFLRAGSPRRWQPGALPVLWVATFGVAWATGSLAVLFLRAPPFLVALRALGWAHAAVAAAGVAYALFATVLRLTHGGTGAEPVESAG